jgi:hypothetical protein
MDGKSFEKGLGPCRADDEETEINLIQMTIFFKIRMRYLTGKFAN